MSKKDAEYKMCSKCIMDTVDDPAIEFDNDGVCTYCHRYDELVDQHLVTTDRENKRENLFKEISSNKNKDGYDCIIGISGGVDSCYVAYLAKQNGLNPLLVHLDNGWNSSLANQNIHTIVKKLDLDLYTYVIDWEEFKDIQLAFIKASVVDIELVTDFAIVACMYNLANKHKLKHIVSGHNVSSEGALPGHWVHWKSDFMNIVDIHKKFGKLKMKTFPKMGYFRKALYVQKKKIKIIPLLNYFDYDKEKAKEFLIKEMGWVDYGGKHYESIFTRFYQAYILPKKFNIDKRKAHLSALICAEQMTKPEALKVIETKAYEYEGVKEDKEYVLKKFGFTEEEFDTIMSQEPIEHTQYASYMNKHYKREIQILKFLRPISRPIKKILGIKAENNIV
jgi:N-acetyl sugar amidotransferase